MSFLLRGESQTRTTWDLKAYTTIRIPPLCIGVIPHEVGVLPAYDGPLTLKFHIWLLRKPHALAELNLLVDQGPINAIEPVVTRVFNLSNRQVRIKRGDVISYLACILVE